MNELVGGRLALPVSDRKRYATSRLRWLVVMFWLKKKMSTILSLCSPLGTRPRATWPTCPPKIATPTGAKRIACSRRCWHAWKTPRCKPRRRPNRVTQSYDILHGNDRRGDVILVNQQRGLQTMTKPMQHLRVGNAG